MDRLPSLLTRSCRVIGRTKGSARFGTLLVRLDALQREADELKLYLAAVLRC